MVDINQTYSVCRSDKEILLEEDAFFFGCALDIAPVVINLQASKVAKAGQVTCQRCVCFVLSLLFKVDALLSNGA